MYRQHVTVRTHAHFFSLRTPHVITRLASQGPDVALCVQKSHFIFGHVFSECSLTPFLRIFSSSTASPTPLTGIRHDPRAAPLWGGPSVHLADPTPNTVRPRQRSWLLSFPSASLEHLSSCIQKFAIVMPFKAPEQDRQHSPRRG